MPIPPVFGKELPPVFGGNVPPIFDGPTIDDVPVTLDVASDAPCALAVAGSDPSASPFFDQLVERIGRMTDDQFALLAGKPDANLDDVGHFVKSRPVAGLSAMVHAYGGDLRGLAVVGLAYLLLNQHVGRSYSREEKPGGRAALAAMLDGPAGGAT